MASNELSKFSGFLRRGVTELAIVFLGVLAALWVDASQDAREREARAVAIATAMSEEIRSLTDWFNPWRASVDSSYADWKTRVARGERPAPFYFRMPGAEHGPQVGWNAGVASGLLDVFDEELVFEVGNMYHEWHEIGLRVARYHDSTEDLLFPAVAEPSLAWRATSAGDGGSMFLVGDPDVETTWVRYVEVPSALRPEYAANLALMEEVLNEMDHKYSWAGEVRLRLDSALVTFR